LGVFFLLLGVDALGATHEHPVPVVLAPGYADLEFEPPPAGSYRLPPLGEAVDGEVLASDGGSLRLHDLMGQGPLLLSFIYTSCSDVNGCPLATHVLSKTSSKLKADASIADRLRMVSLSFDPEHDTPAVMRRYSAPFADGGLDWRFLTTRSQAELDPILTGYDQWVIRDRDETGRPLGTMSHLLRVYLIDSEKRIRNIYSVSFLHADTLANDVRTLLMEADGG
jgi:cytochrome c peroxidase